MGLTSLFLVIPKTIFIRLPDKLNVYNIITLEKGANRLQAYMLVSLLAPKISVVVFFHRRQNQCDDPDYVPISSGLFLSNFPACALDAGVGYNKEVVAPKEASVR